MEIIHRRARVTRGARSALACILGVVALPVAGSTQQASFTAAQAEAGAAVYQTACAVCHLVSLQGSDEAPQLVGTDFRRFRGNQPAVDLMRYVGATMPPGQEGSLTEEEYTAVTAYIMRENGVGQGSAPLSLASRDLSSSVGRPWLRLGRAESSRPFRDDREPGPHRRE